MALGTEVSGTTGVQGSKQQRYEHASKHGTYRVTQGSQEVWKHRQAWTELSRAASLCRNKSALVISALRLESTHRAKSTNSKTPWGEA